MDTIYSIFSIILVFLIIFIEYQKSISEFFFVRKEIPKLDDLIKLTSEEIVDDGFQIESEVNTNLKPFNWILGENEMISW